MKEEKKEEDVPGDWTPRGGEEEYEDADKRNGRFLSRKVIHDDSPLAVLACCRRPQNSNNQLRDGHPDSPEEQDRPPPPFINRVQSRNRRAHVNTVDNQGNDELILEPGVLEKLRPVVDDEIYPR